MIFNRFGADEHTLLLRFPGRTAEDFGAGTVDRALNAATARVAAALPAGVRSDLWKVKNQVVVESAVGTEEIVFLPCRPVKGWPVFWRSAGVDVYREAGTPVKVYRLNCAEGRAHLAEPLRRGDRLFASYTVDTKGPLFEVSSLASIVTDLAAGELGVRLWSPLEGHAAGGAALAQAWTARAERRLDDLLHGRWSPPELKAKRRLPPRPVAVNPASP